MEDHIRFILAAFDELTDKERRAIIDRLPVLMPKLKGFSAEELAGLGADELETLRAVMSGMILTKRYVPDMIGAYARMNDLPSRVSFGRMEEEPE